MTSFLPQCMVCKHFNAADRLKETCTAFPDGIPAVILNNRVDHREEYPGDNGVRWAAVDQPGVRHPLEDEE